MRGRRGDGCYDAWRARLLYLPSCAMALLSAVCLLVLDMATAASVHDDRTPVLPDGSTPATLRDWAEWSVRLASNPRALVLPAVVRAATQVWHTALGLGGHRRPCTDVRSRRPVEELRPLVSEEQQADGAGA